MTVELIKRLYLRSLPYLVAIGSTIAALLLSLWLEPLISRTLGTFFCLAIIVTSWYGGFRVGLVAIFLSVLALDFFLFPLQSISPQENILRLVLFVTVAIIINLLTSNWASSKKKIRKLLQQIAQDNAKQLRMALEAAQMGIWTWNLVTGKIIWSPEHEQLFGLAAGSFDGKYETFAACVHPEDISLLNQAVQQAQETHSSFYCEFRVVWPDGSIHWIEGRGRGIYNSVGEPVHMTGTAMAIDERKQTQGLLQQQFEQQALVMKMTQQIRQSLNLQDILQTTVEEIRQFLGCDRVIVFQFAPGWCGTTVVESVAAEWMAILPLQIHNPCIGEEHIALFKQGLVTAKADIYNAGISPCHIEFLDSLQVKANLVVPILLKDKLWGLLAAHHCAAPREWQSSEITLLQQVGEQVSIAIQQAVLFAQVQTELRERQQAELALQITQSQLEHQLAEIENIYQSAPVGLAVLDTNLRFVRINQHLAQTNGFSIESHIGSTVRDLLPNFADTIEVDLLSVLSTEKPLLNIEMSGQSQAQPGVQRTWIASYLPLKAGERIIGISALCEEITERKRAEQSLQEKTAILSLFAKYAPAGIAMFDKDMRYLMASQRWVDEYDLDSVESLIGRSHYEIFPEIPQRWRQIHQRCLAGISEKCDEDLFVRADGKHQWLSWEVHPWYTATGEIGGIIAFSDDITQRRQTQLELQQLNAELEQRVAQRTEELTTTNDLLLETLLQQQQNQRILAEQVQLLDLAHDSIISRQLNGVITFWNQGAEKMYGWTKTEALGQISYTLLQTQFPQPWPEIEAQLLTTGYWEGELTHFCRDAQSITVASRWVLQTDNTGQPIKILEINNDITLKKQTEADLQKYLHEIEDLYNNAPCGYHSLDAEGNYIQINHTELHWLGFSREQVIHQNYSDFLTEESKKIWHDNFSQLKQQGWMNNVELEFITKDNTSRWISLNATVIKDEVGNFVMTRSTSFDITEKQATLEELQRTTAILHQYERIVSTTQDPIILLNSNYIYQIINPAFLNWCHKSESQVLGHSVRDVLGENLFDSFIKDLLDRGLAGESIQYERWFDFPNIVPQFMSVNYTPYREADGRISGVIVSLRDITQLKQTQQLLELQAVITRNMAEGICLVKADNGVIVYANPKFEQMFGYDPGELNGHHVSIVNYANDSLTPEDVHRSIESSILEQGEVTYEVHNVKKDGTEFWSSATASVFNHPDYGDVFVAVQQDITERKRIADDLRESEEKFRQLAENIQAVFWMTDAKHEQVLYASPAYESIWQRSCESLSQNPQGWLDAIHPQDRQGVEMSIPELIVTGQYNQKYRIIRPDGSIRWISDRAFPIKNESGEIIRLAGLVEDITEQQKIAEMKNEFISIVSHELRTPLTAIQAALDLLNSGIYDQKPDRFKRMLEIASIDCDRLVRLVNDILDIERLESGKLILEKTTCQVNELIEQAVMIVQPLAQQQYINFNIYPTEAQVWAEADGMIQTLTNLVGNAIKFSPPHSTITIRVEQQPDFVLVQVTDQGQGIPTEKLETIFEKFQQVDASDSRSKGGTGLGLAICRSIISQHGGRIWAESTLGLGSTFSFTLPVC